MSTLASSSQASDTRLRELKRHFRGHLIEPDDARYDDERRVWNGSIDRHPALIARCARVTDVVAALDLARQTGMPVAVRSGGHSFPGASVCDGGLVIELSPIKRIQVDPVTAGRGCRPVSCSASSIGRRRRMVSPSRPGSSPTRASPASPSAAGSAG